MTATKAPAKKKPAAKKATSAKRGRPSTYSPAVADEICERIAKGEPLRQICRDDHMPEWRTVYGWQDKHPDFLARIGHARELGEEAIAQECFDIADNAANDWMEVPSNDGGVLHKLNGEHIQRSKLRIETRLKLLAKWNPRKWGERQHVEHSGKVGLESLIAGD